jgi:hypothetical protein
MASTYTTRAKLAKPGTNDTGWGTTVNADLDAIDAIEPVGGLMVTPAETPSTTLNVAVAAGDFRKSDGTLVSYAGTASFACTGSATNSIYLSDAGTLTKSTTGYPAATDIVRLATVVAGTSTLTSVTDDRSPFLSYGSASASGAPTTATYIVQTAHASLSAEQALSALATGLLKNTTTTGVLSIASPTADYMPYDAELAQIAALADPNADRILFWDDSAGAYTFLTIGTNLTITGTTLNATGGAGGGDFSSNTATSVDNEVVLFSGTGGKTGKRATLTATVVKSTSGVLSAATANTDYIPGFADPNADRIVFWDDSAGAFAALTPGTGLTITGTTIDVSAGGGDASTNTATSVDSEIALFSGTGGKTLKRATTTGVLKASSGVIAAAVAGTDYMTPSGSGASLTSLNATQLTTGTVPTARLGSGTADANAFLMGDQTYKYGPTVIGSMSFQATINLSDGVNLNIGGTTGTQIGGLTSKLGFFGKTPVVQQGPNADTSGATLGQLETEVNELKAMLRLYGLLA